MEVDENVHEDVLIWNLKESKVESPDHENKLRILFQNSSSIFTFRGVCVDKRDMPPYLHYMTFKTT